MNLSDLEYLRCPYCLKKLELEENYSDSNDKIHFGIVKCSCSRFPITHGILNFGGKWNLGIKKAVAYLRKGEFEKACAVQMELESLPPSNLFRFLRKLSLKHLPIFEDLTNYYRVKKGDLLLHKQTFVNSLMAIGKNSFHNYLKHRFALPSFYKSIPLLIFIKEQDPKLILDLGCGAGHYSFVMDNLCPEARIISIDQHYAYLYLAKKFLSPNSLHICLNAKDPSPLKEKSADIIFSSDMLQWQIERGTIMNHYRSVLCKNGFFVGPRFGESWMSDSHIFTEKERQGLFKNLRFSVLSEDCIMKAFSEEDSISFQEVRIDKGNCTDFRSTSIIGSFGREIGSLTISNISNKFSKAGLSWMLRPEYQETMRKNSHRFYTLNTHQYLTPGHYLEWQSFFKNVVPETISIPETAFVKGTGIRKDYPELPDLIRKGVAVLAK